MRAIAEDLKVTVRYCVKIVFVDDEMTETFHLKICFFGQNE